MSKEDLIALIGQKDMLLQEQQTRHSETLQQKDTEIAKLRRMLFGQKRERFEISPIQLPLDFGETLSEKEIKVLEELINKKTESVKRIRPSKCIFSIQIRVSIFEIIIKNAGIYVKARIKSNRNVQVG